MGNVRYVPEPGFERAILRSSFIRELLQGPIEVGAQTAQARAPKRTGRLTASVDGVVEFDPELLRFVGRIQTDDFKALWQERGTKKQRPRPYLLPGLAAAAPGARIVTGGRRSGSVGP